MTAATRSNKATDIAFLISTTANVSRAGVLWGVLLGRILMVQGY